MTEQELFLAAVEIADASVQRAYLDRACAGDPALMERVEKLLLAHATAQDFLSIPALKQMSGKTTAIDGDRTPVDSESDELTIHFPGEQKQIGGLPLNYLLSSTKPGSLGRLAHYDVEEILGQGSFGTVLKAFDEKLHRLVAIKVLSPELAATSPPRQRFLREARTCAAVRHEHVVAIHAVEEQPIPYLVMEYIPGVTLQRALDEHGPFDVPNVLRIGRQIASGLAAAHALGLIHRDIKPSNILLENGISGTVKITDFGLARAADDASLTQSNVILGTPMYMSPEQASNGVISPSSDLFSLGSVLYVMVTGRPPFRGASTLAVLRRVVDETPRPIPEIISGIPAWFCAIVEKLQSKDPSQRFSSAQEVTDLLAHCLADLQANRPVQLPANIEPLATPPTVAGHSPVVAVRSPSPAKRFRFSGTRITAALILLLIGLGVTDATGVTRIAPTVIRLTSGSGTLVIETEDPGVVVTIDGEAISIHGAGVEQLTLKPGKYRIAATKDGEPVSQQLVTITRGRREVVRISLNAAVDGNHQSISPGAEREAEVVAILPLAEGGFEVVAPTYRAQVSSMGLLNSLKVGDDTLVESTRFGGLSGRIGSTGDVAVTALGTTLTFVQGTDYRLEYEFRANAFTVHTRISAFAAQRDAADQKPFFIFYDVAFPVSARTIRPLDGGHEFPLPAEQFMRTSRFVAAFENGAEIKVSSPATEAGFNWGLSASPYSWSHGYLELDVDNRFRFEIRSPPNSAVSNLDEVGWPSDAPPWAIAPFDAAQAQVHQQQWAEFLGAPVEFTNSIGMKFRLIPPGEFLMGSTPEEIEAALAAAAKDDYWPMRIQSEGPRHKTVVKRPIYVGVHEVTQADYELVMGQNPSHFTPTGSGREHVLNRDTRNHPVDQVTWDDAAEFCLRLSERERRRGFDLGIGVRIAPADAAGYRLLTEAEWEFACRAGTTGLFGAGNDAKDLAAVGWCGMNSAARTHAVGELPANPWGLHDVHGNVWEWVHATWHPAYEEPPVENPSGTPVFGTYRGGSFAEPAECCRPATRNFSSPWLRDPSVGFRVVLAVEPRRTTASGQ